MSRGDSAGKFAATRHAWVMLPKFEAVIHYGVYDDADTYELEGTELEPVRLAFKYPGSRRATTLHLTGMTADELKEFRRLVNLACDLAEPICEALDQHAQEGFENGDTTFARLYRPVPRLYVRERSQPSHGEGVPNGPGGVPVVAGDPAPGSDATGLRDDDGIVSDGNASGRSPVHDQAQAGDVPVVREILGKQELPG